MAITIPEPLITNLVNAAQEVFETMVFKPLDARPLLEHVPSREGPHVVATVAFAGHRCGLVSFHSSIDTAREIAGAMLGIPAETVNGEMPDAIGEVANMIAGTLRTRMAGIEPAWAIAVPTVTIGTDFRTSYAAGITRVVAPFEMEGQPVDVELVLHGGN